MLQTHETGSDDAGEAGALEEVLAGAAPRQAAPCFTPACEPHAAADLHRRLADALDEARTLAERDPQGNPILILAQEIERRVDSGEMAFAGMEAVVQRLLSESFAGRAAALRDGLGSVCLRENDERLTSLFRALARQGDFAAYRRQVEVVHQGIVFTAHPTFSLNRELSRLLARLVLAGTEGGPDAEAQREIFRQVMTLPHRPPERLTLRDEYDWSVEALEHALVALNRARRCALAVAREQWPEDWQTLVPALADLATWVGFDQDGRADIGWDDSLAFRLDLKLRALRRMAEDVRRLCSRAADPLEQTLELLASVLDLAIAQSEESLGRLQAPMSPDRTQEFASRLVGSASTQTSAQRLRSLLDRAIALADDPEVRTDLLLHRAALASHGLSLARVHFRINATQLHNAIRHQIGLTTDPEDPSHRRSYLSQMNELIAATRPLTSNLGALLAEGASAKRVFLVMAQIVKHVDRDAPIRFLIAETDSAFTLLVALHYARLFGLQDQIDISPLFETEHALEHGAEILGEALKSPHWREYLRRRGRLCLQFGFSDSGRYLGQMGATFAIERLRRRIAELLGRQGLTDVRVVLFNTHGESVGRGGHPLSIADRFRYLAPPANRAEFAQRGIALTEESSFQGGDGYLHFLSTPSAYAVLTRGLEFHMAPEDAEATGDPIYAQPDFAAEFFATVRQFFTGLVDDRDYAILLSAFGQNLLFKTGSRPARRQSEDWGRPKTLDHPSQLRAIPNNALLQQLGHLANTIGGLGKATALDRETFLTLRAESPRFRRAMTLVEHALAVSDLDVFGAYIDSLDPGLWLNRSGRTGDLDQRQELRRVAEGLERLDLHAALGRVRRHLQADTLTLEEAFAAGPELGTAAQHERLVLLHALRIALIHRIYRLATRIPEFSPRHELTVEELRMHLFQLDVPAAVDLLRQVFPRTQETALGEGLDFAEPSEYRPAAAATYEREHAEIFDPLLRLHELARRIGTGVSYRIGAHG